MQSFIPVYQPELAGNEKKYVNECLDTSWISSKGRFVSEFENAFSKVTGSPFATAVSNGTVALHLALLALNVGPGDEVIVPTFTYIASVNAIRYVGATPIFVDSESDSWQIDCECVEKAISKNTKAIIAVHIYGHPCDLERLQALAKHHNIFLVEDCAEAFGSRIKNTHVGNFSDIATYSFFGNKTVTTGEGGMVVSKSSELDETVRHLKGQGLMPGREYWHNVVGYNYRMTNICAAIGLAQLENAEDLLRRKKWVAEYYLTHLQALPIEFQSQNSEVEHSWWMFSILTNSSEDRDALRDFLAKKGIETRPLFNPVHLMPMYLQDGIRFPIAEALSKRGLNLPSWPGLTLKQLEYIVSSIKTFYE